MIARAVLCAVLMSAACGAMALQAGEDAAGGTATGILASKGETWIGVKPEGQDEAALYLPVWKGGLPRDGGGFDKETLALIKSLVVGSKVKLVWKALDEHPRIISVETLALPEKKVETAAVPDRPRGTGEGGKPRLSPERERPVAEGEKRKPPDSEKPAAESEKPVAESEKPKKAIESEKAQGKEPKAEADSKPAVTTGVVTAKGESYIEVRDSEATTQQFYARVLGGELGNLDKEMLKQIGRLKIGDHVRIEWSFQDRRRIMKKLVSASQE